MSLRDRGHVNADGSAEFGAQLPEDGVHVFRILEGIRLTEPTEFGRSIFIQFVVDDESDDSNGRKFGYFIRVEGDNQQSIRTAEGHLITLLIQLGLDEEVEKAFNDPDFLFDNRILGDLVEFLNMKLPGRYIKLNTVQDKSGKKCYFINSWAVNTAPKASTNPVTSTGGVQYG